VYTLKEENRSKFHDGSFKLKIERRS